MEGGGNPSTTRLYGGRPPSLLLWNLSFCLWCSESLQGGKLGPHHPSLALNTAQTNCCAGPWRGVSFHPHKRDVIEAREWRSWDVSFPRQPTAQEELWGAAAAPGGWVPRWDSRCPGDSQHLIKAFEVWVLGSKLRLNRTVFRCPFATSRVAYSSSSLSFTSLKWGQ